LIAAVEHDEMGLWFSAAPDIAAALVVGGSREHQNHGTPHLDVE
jgi:hypothetical protein